VPPYCAGHRSTAAAQSCNAAMQWRDVTIAMTSCIVSHWCAHTNTKTPTHIHRQIEMITWYPLRSLWRR